MTAPAAISRKKDSQVPVSSTLLTSCNSAQWISMGKEGHPFWLVKSKGNPSQKNKLREREQPTGQLGKGSQYQLVKMNMPAQLHPWGRVKNQSTQWQPSNVEPVNHNGAPDSWKTSDIQTGSAKLRQGTVGLIVFVAFFIFGVQATKPKQK